MSDPVEYQFASFKPDPEQRFDIDMLPDERQATKTALRAVVDLVASSPAVLNAMGQVLLTVSRTYEDELLDTHFGMDANERDARNQHTRGVIAGLARARDYLTNPHYAAELYKRLDPENKEM